MFVSIRARKLNDEDSVGKRLSVDCCYEFTFGHYIDDYGIERIDYTSFWLRGSKKDSHNIERDFEIEMSPAEISQLVDFVIEKRLVSFHARAAYRDH